MSLARRALEHCEIQLLESPLGQRMLAAYRRLPDQEQRLVWVLGAVTLIGLLVLLIIAPATRFALDSMQHYRRANTDYHWLQAQADQARRIAAVRRAATERGDLQQLLIGAAAAYNLRIGRSEELAGGGLRVWLDGIAFADLMAWLDSLKTQHKLHVARLDVDVDDGPGRVRARADFVP